MKNTKTFLENILFWEGEGCFSGSQEICGYFSSSRIFDFACKPLESCDDSLVPRAQWLVPVPQSHPFFIVLEFLSWHTQAEERDYTGQAPGAAVTISSTIHRRVTCTV